MEWMKRMRDDGRPYFHPNRLIQGSHSIAPAKPIEVGTVRQLLVDDYIVDTSWNCSRTVHQPHKYEGNPVINPETPWEVGIQNCGSLLDDGGRMRFWTVVHRQVGAEEKGIGVYYESEDGMHWTRPHVGAVDWEGDRHNNIFWGGAQGDVNTVSVLKLPPVHRFRGQYAMLYSCTPEVGSVGEVRVALSEDGIRFRDQPENPAIRGRSDTHNNLVYNPERSVFMQYRRATVNAHEIRRLAYSESGDLASWTQPVVIFNPDELDPPFLYDLTVVRYQGIYLGFLHMFYSVNAGYKTGPRIWASGQIEKEERMDVQLAWSRDGIRWSRHPLRPIFLPTGIRGVDPDWGMVTMNQGIVEREGRLYMLYYGYEGLHSDPSFKINLCMATLRVDGFVSLDTPTIGYMLTRPILCPGGQLHINARTGKGGYVRVAVRRGDGVDDGVWLPGWGYDEGSVFEGDSTGAVMEWTDRGDFGELEDRAIRLHFWLRNAEIYSFWFDGCPKPAG